MCHYFQPVYLFTRWNKLRMKKKSRRNNRAHDELVLSLMPLWLKFASRNATHVYEWLLIEYNLDATTLKPNYPHSLLSYFQRIVRTYFVSLYPPVHTCTHEWLHSRLKCIRMKFWIETDDARLSIRQFNNKNKMNNQNSVCKTLNESQQHFWYVRQTPIINGDKLVAKIWLEIRCNRFRNNALILVGPWSRVVSTLHTHSHLSADEAAFVFAKTKKWQQTRKSFGCCSAIAVIHRSLVGWRFYGINFSKRHIKPIYRRALLLPANAVIDLLPHLLQW